MHGRLHTDLFDRLLTNSHGQPRALLANAVTWLRHAPEWQGVIKYDSFGMQTMAAAPPPWEAGHNGFTPREWTSRDDVLATNDLQIHGIAVSVETMHTAIETVAHDNAYHPVQDYLDGLKWDGKERLPTFFSAYLGAEDSRYSRAVGEKFMISAVARIRHPGCKADHVPVLEGKQGLGKSSAIKALSEPWFSDDIADLGSKDAAMQVRSAWFIEISELDAMSRADVGRIKAFLTRTTDRFRPPYGRRVIEAPRECVFIGTTNSDAYLRDETGGRRFWPIHAKRIDVDAIARDRDQIWAEAAQRYRRRESWWIDDADVLAEAAAAQAERLVEDPWTNTIASYLSRHNVKDVSVDEVFASVLSISIERRTQAEMNRVARILVAQGYERYQRRSTGDKREWRYRRK